MNEMNYLMKNWWSVLTRGLVAIALGVFAFVWPIVTLTSLVLIFGAYAFIDGVLTIASALSRKNLPEDQPRWLWMAQGIIGIVAGIISFAIPGITALSLLYIMAAWAIVTGILEIAASIRLRKIIEDEWLLAISGALSFAFGILLLMAPPTLGLITLIWIIGAYAIGFGIATTVLGFRLRMIRNQFGDTERFRDWRHAHGH